MDVQRSKRKGKPNYWVVIPLSTEIAVNLKDVQKYLEDKYKSARSELRRAFTDLDSKELHITLFGIHANQARLQQVKAALSAFEQTLSADRTFDIELQGLGAWNTLGGNIILYADFKQQSSDQIKQLAKELRDFVLQHIQSQEGITPADCNNNTTTSRSMGAEVQCVNSFVVHRLIE
jgi:2'-5' RNA ligase